LFSRSALYPGQECRDRFLIDPGHIGVAGVSEVGANHGRGGGIAFDKVCRLGTARQRFDTDATGPGIEIEHARRLDTERSQHRKERLPDPVSHRPGESPRRAFQLKSAPVA
jgi:hypothetical protein